MQDDGHDHDTGQYIEQVEHVLLLISGNQGDAQSDAKDNHTGNLVVAQGCENVFGDKYIDEFNILNASLEAMKKAVENLDTSPEYLLVDGIFKIPMPLPQKCIKKGDQLSHSISASSIIAKVYRDRIMCSHHCDYPVYGFSSNKGYGTAKHLEALKKYGPCPVHRLTFRGVN